MTKEEAIRAMSEGKKAVKILGKKLLPLFK
jgi:hypothetical protein